ncbi:hypothetical protein LTR09_006397 [Extremus antarcticus]|uniref:F-box domain-containing protein n=1 Tax=Extremus antarcticus TaxID=702011 RepID=A0AAJ0G7V7_9PEZI|nr:hypothetical protein LTR09_006397 [Extremus antarcticus]
MALDVQTNWNVSMAENLERTMRRSNRHRTEPPTTLAIHNEDDTVDSTTPRGEPIHLPDELILHILTYTSHLPLSQRTLASCSLLSHQWLAIATPLLYAAPTLYGHSYDPFVRAICPSINQHIRTSPLASLVKVLDMRGLVHQGSKSTTARVLGRVKNNLEEFCAPQASFAINCLPALSKCKRLRVLDLGLVSESPGLLELFKTTAHLTQLHTLRLPRSSGFGVQSKATAFDAVAWPPSLRDLCLSGGIDAHFLHGIVAFPQTLRELTIEHCPNAKGHAVTHLLKTAVRGLQGLETLKVAHMPRLGMQALDGTLRVLPQLKKLSVSADYVTPALFDDFPPVGVVELEDDLEREARCEKFVHSNLRTLELTYSGASSGVEDKITAIDIMIAIDDETVPNLRQVRVDQALLWQGAGSRPDVEALTDVLYEASRRDWEAREGMFAEMGERELEREGVWRTVSGVWIF